MITWTLIVLLTVLKDGWATGAGFPSRAETFMERGKITEEVCQQAAEPYKAFEKLSEGSAVRVTVRWECVKVGDTR